jgi:hypothetical protein
MERFNMWLGFTALFLAASAIGGLFFVASRLP